jgi:antitoxin component YwqK of YwqJK toxin-antitoxin module
MKNILLLLTILPILVIGQKSSNINSQKELFIKKYPSGKLFVKGYKENGNLVDTVWTYFEDGKIKTIEVFYDKANPNRAYVYQNFRGSSVKHGSGYFNKIDDQVVQDSVWKYYRKNGSVMDCVIYKNNKIIYRARLNSKGKVVFEEK